MPDNRPRLGRPRRALPSEPDLSPAFKAAIEAALRWAWREVRSATPQIVQHGKEEDITEQMQRMLNEQDPATSRRRAPGLAGFETVDRGAKVTTADGRIEKAPDLVFRPAVATGVRHRGDWGMFVECKIIGPERHHSPDEYCAKGLAKFAIGEYSARMRSGGMVAYVRDGRLPFAALGPILQAMTATTVHQPGSVLNKCGTRHGRSSLPKPCVDITVSHLWLDAQPALASSRTSNSRAI